MPIIVKAGGQQRVVHIGLGTPCPRLATAAGTKPKLGRPITRLRIERKR